MTALRPGTSPPPVRIPMRFLAMASPPYTLPCGWVSKTVGLRADHGETCIRCAGPRISCASTRSENAVGGPRVPLGLAGESQLLLELRLPPLGEGRDAFLVVLGQAQLLVSVAFDLEADADAGLVGGGEHALNGLERERRLRDELRDRVVDLPVELPSILHDPREQAPLIGLGRRNAAAEHHHVGGAGEAGDAGNALAAAAAGNLAERDLGQGQQRVLRRDADVAG